MVARTAARVTALSSASALRAVMDGVPAAVAVVDGGMLVREANARWRAIGPAVGRDWREVVHPADRDLVPSGPGASAEVRVRMPDGGVRWFSLAVRAADDGGAVVLTDIDAGRAAEGERAALRRIADGISREDDSGALFDQVAEEAGVLLSADGAGVVRFDDEARTAVMLGRWAVDPALADVSPQALPLEGPGATARVYATGLPARAVYPSEAPFPWRAAVVVPIRVGGLLWGALGAVSLDGTRLTEDAEQRLSRFAELVGLAVANADARERLMRQARTDPLTGLPHHGTFHRQLDEEIARAARFGSVLSLAVIDIDHFKTVNDAHGHEVGDATLRAVAARLSSHARVIDLAARVGGEEFGWLMPGTPLPGARVAAERFRSAVAGEGFGPVASLTVSVGVAQLTDLDPDGSALFRRADAALFAAKAAGRDRTMAAEPA
ncbi:MAG TPA: sensor domain-containing diguanylate cyclase [Miltoncostaeaceae bacterium]|nr:sensor domain-containing diguanylate cyclase [Miltoncostaeaceae bacterium]